MKHECKPDFYNGFLEQFSMFGLSSEIYLITFSVMHTYMDCSYFWNQLKYIVIILILVSIDIIILIVIMT